MMIYTIPVSYTHLDVYKRQLQWRGWGKYQRRFWAYSSDKFVKGLADDDVPWWVMFRMKMSVSSVFIHLQFNVGIGKNPRNSGKEQKARTLYTAALEKYSAQLNLQSTSKEKKTTNDTIPVSYTHLDVYKRQD